MKKVEGEEREKKESARERMEGGGWRKEAERNERGFQTRRLFGKLILRRILRWRTSVARTKRRQRKGQLEKSWREGKRESRRKGRTLRMISSSKFPISG